MTIDDEIIRLYNDLLTYSQPVGDKAPDISAVRSETFLSVCSRLHLDGWLLELFRYCACEHILGLNAGHASLAGFAAIHHQPVEIAHCIWSSFAEHGLIQNKWCWLEDKPGVPLIYQRIVWSRAVWCALCHTPMKNLYHNTSLSEEKGAFKEDWCPEYSYDKLVRWIQCNPIRLYLYGSHGTGKTFSFIHIASQFHREVYTSYAENMDELREHAQYVLLCDGILHVPDSIMINPALPEFRSFWINNHTDICFEGHAFRSEWAALTPCVQVLEWKSILPEQRYDAITALIPQLSEAEAQRISARHQLHIGDIADLQKCFSGQSYVSEHQVSHAIRELSCNVLTGVATLDRLDFQLEELILPDEIMENIEQFCARYDYLDEVRARYRDRGKSVSRRAVALFSGSPGVGKTMAARWVAKKLGLPCLRVDLSQLMSKYIGETEKNLALVFDEAVKSDVLLLFDEADSLFSKRTNVKSSHDRYANIEINYLLQRIEKFEGIAVLTTNFAHSMDEAFERRIDFHIHFDTPDVPNRVLLWMHYLPQEEISHINVEALAEKIEISGALIRRTSEQAMFASAKSNTPISTEMLTQLAKRELAAAGSLIAQK